MKNVNESIINQVSTRMISNKVASIFILLILFAFNPKGYTQTFIEHPVDQNFPGISNVKILDLDKDGDLDIIGGSEHTPWTTSVGIAWGEPTVVIQFSGQNFRFPIVFYMLCLSM